MGRPSALDKLPGDLRDELDQRLRQSFYSDYDEIYLWIRGKGIHSSRSAIGRYGKRLKAKDKAVEGLSVVLGATGKDIDEKEAMELLIELGALRLREVVIIDKLREIGIPGHSGIRYGKK